MKNIMFSAKMVIFVLFYASCCEGRCMPSMSAYWVMPGGHCSQPDGQSDPATLQTLSHYGEHSTHVAVKSNGRADSRLPPSQWEMSLQSNAISHWLGRNLESALKWESMSIQVQYLMQASIKRSSGKCFLMEKRLNCKPIAVLNWMSFIW